MDATQTLAPAELNRDGDKKPLADPNSKRCMITASGVQKINTEHTVGCDHNVGADLYTGRS